MLTSKSDQARPLSIGEHVSLSAGYDMEPDWLHGGPGYTGIVSRFIPGQNDNSAAVIELNSAISVAEVTGKILVLELRYVGAKWTGQNTVHVELCDFEPEPKAWQFRRQGKWIESHATCMRIDSPSARCD